MTDKSRTTWPIGAPEFFRQFNPSALIEMQRRNMEAATRSASTISEATVSVANKLNSAFSKLSANWPSEMQAAKGNVGDAVAAQLRASREAVESAIGEMRSANDVARQCWHDVAGEFEAWFSHALNSMEQQLKQSATPERKISPVAPAPEHHRKAAAE
ncbi:MAG TPA: phasin family protein [Alphaproteobacteria bacterium]|nr:phasin family protein [Alphaproteobacteria bacterium]